MGEAAKAAGLHGVSARNGRKSCACTPSPAAITAPMGALFNNLVAGVLAWCPALGLEALETAV